MNKKPISARDRYNSSLFNPYNEVECGDHFDRAKAAWGVLLSLSGYSYRGPGGKLGFASVGLQGRAHCGRRVGVFEQRHDRQFQRERLTLRWAELRLNELTLNVPHDNAQPAARIAMNRKEIAGKLVSSEETMTIPFVKSVFVKRNEMLEISFTFQE